MKTQLELYQCLAQSLANLFVPMVEVGLFDQTHSVICLYNRLTSDAIPSLEAHQALRITINKNQTVKAMLLPLDQGYYLRLLVDVSLFESLQVFLQQYLVKKTPTPEILHWQQQVDQIISTYLQTQNTVLSALNSQEKRALVLELHEKKIFCYQDATNYLAAKLEVSRATIYNYLKQANQIRSLQIHQVDAFTDEPFSGNPAGVVLDADHLNDAMMKKITREMNLSETSFMLTSEKADIKLRYFTPNGSEVKFCGHSTVGALYMLAHNKLLGMDKPGNYQLSIEAKVGIVPAAITLAQDQTVTIEFQSPKTVLVNSKITHLDIARALGINVNVLTTQQPIMYEKTNQDLFVTVKSLKQLGELQIDQKAAKQFAETHKIVAFVLLCNEGIAKNSHIHMRCFAPAVGIAEDPFTGSVLGGLAEYISRNHLIDKRVKTVRVEQGHFISRPGYVELKLNQTPGKPPTVIAKARHFFSTQIEL